MQFVSRALKSRYKLVCSQYWKHIHCTNDLNFTNRKINVLHKFNSVFFDLKISWVKWTVVLKLFFYRTKFNKQIQNKKLWETPKQYVSSCANSDGKHSRAIHSSTRLRNNRKKCPFNYFFSALQEKSIFIINIHSELDSSTI